MPGSKSNFTEKVVLDLFLGAVAYTPPLDVFIALSTALYDDNATGAAMTEVSTTNTGYLRKQVANNATSWPAAAVLTVGGPTTKQNGVSIAFPTATGNWGEIKSFYILDSLTVGAGNVLYGGDLTVIKSILTGDTATFAVKSISITEE